MEPRKGGDGLLRRHAGSFSNLQQLQQRCRDRLRCSRNLAIYLALGLATAVLLLYRHPLQPQAGKVLHSRVVLEESFGGYQPGAGGAGGVATRWHRSWTATAGGEASSSRELSQLSRQRQQSGGSWGVARSLYPGSRGSGSSSGSSSVMHLTNAHQQVVRQAAKTAPSIWLYSLIPADYDGATVLPHWIKHYMALGIRTANFLVLVNHNPDKYSDEGVRDVVKVLNTFGVKYRVWRGQYSSEQHLKQKLILFNEVVTNLEDWILIADSDEFQDYGGMPIPLFLAQADMQGATFVRGDMIDRVALDGAMPPMEPAPSIYEQFPLQCHVVANLYGGKTKKIAAFKAFLRSNQGNHKMVPPEHAKEYFGPALPGELSLRGGFFGSEDFYPLTPYAQYHERYVYRGVPHSPGSAWDDVPYSLTITVLHFKWHAAVLRNMQDRVKFYKGSADEGGLPRYKHYTEAEKVVEALTELGHLNLTGLHCSSAQMLQQQRIAQQQQQQQQPWLPAAGGAAAALARQ